MNNNNNKYINKKKKKMQESTSETPASQTGSTSLLTLEQLKRIEENRLKAKEKRLEKQKDAQQSPTTSSQVIPEKEQSSQKQIKPKRKFQNYVEFDLSKMVDSKGGFILDESEDERNPKKRKIEKIVITDPSKDFFFFFFFSYHYFRIILFMIKPSKFSLIVMSINPDENPRCKECNLMDIDAVFHEIFHVKVCQSCKEKYPEKFSLLTKTEVKEVFVIFYFY